MLETTLPIWGWYRHIIGYPNLMGYTPCYSVRVNNDGRCLWQVYVEAFGELVWININPQDFIWKNN